MKWLTLILTGVGKSLWFVIFIIYKIFANLAITIFSRILAIVLGIVLFYAATGIL